MVDSALAACQPPTDQGLVVHVDIHLHRAVLTGIEVHDSVRRVFNHSLEGHGLVQLHDRWVKLIADLFVQTTRFDPLHRAESEQAIYDRLPLWLSALEARESLGVEMAARDGGVHVIRLSRAEIVECAREFYVRVGAALGEFCAGRAFTLQLADNAHRLPGLATVLQSAAGHPALCLPSGAGALGALRHASKITDGGWRNTLTVSLPRNVFVQSETMESNP
jgi:hypothetical protein